MCGFGKSGPMEQLYACCGFTAENIADRVKTILKEKE